MYNPTLLFQSRKHANKVRLYYMLHPVDGGCPAKKLRTDDVSILNDTSVYVFANDCTFFLLFFYPSMYSHYSCSHTSCPEPFFEKIKVVNIFF